MKKSFILAILILVLALPAYASQNNHGNSNKDNNNSQGQNHGNGNGNKNSNDSKNTSNNALIIPTVFVTSDPTNSPTPTNTQALTPSVTVVVCDPTLNWKNHGAYVSCVAHMHAGGSSVSEAAKSDIGKKHDKNDITPSPTSILSGTPSATPSPITSALPGFNGAFAPLTNLGALLGKIFGFFKHLL